MLMSHPCKTKFAACFVKGGRKRRGFGAFFAILLRNISVKKTGEPGA